MLECVCVYAIIDEVTLLITHISHNHLIIEIISSCIAVRAMPQQLMIFFIATRR